MNLYCGIQTRCYLKKLNEIEGKEQYHVEISNRFASLENLDDEVDINRAWVTIRQNIKISAKESLGYYELKKKHKPWLMLKLDQRNKPNCSGYGIQVK
jgi:hypothetical protein